MKLIIVKSQESLQTKGNVSMETFIIKRILPLLLLSIIKRWNDKSFGVGDVVHK